MSTAVWTDRGTESATRFKARAAGFFWLMTFLTSAFAVITGGRLIVSGDAAATASNLLANESLYRLALTSNLIAGACYLAATLLVYELLKPVNRGVSLMAAFFSLLGVAGGAVSTLLYFAPLVVQGGSRYLSVYTGEQTQALALLFLGLGEQASAISFGFFGLHCLLVGWLISRSTFLPRLVGALMAFGGLGWLTLSLANLLSPPLARSLIPYITIPGLIGELSLTLWLLVKAVNAQRWKEQAGASAALAIPEHA